MKTSVYLEEGLHGRLRRIAFAEGISMNDLVVRGLETLLADMADPQVERERAVAATETLRTEVAALAVERDKLANQVGEMQEAFRRAIAGEHYRKGKSDRAEAVAFWDSVAENAAAVIDDHGRPMTAAEIVPHLSVALRVEAASGGAEITSRLLRKKMSMKRSHGKLFVGEETETFRTFSLRDIPAVEGRTRAA